MEDKPTTEGDDEEIMNEVIRKAKESIEGTSPSSKPVRKKPIKIAKDDHVVRKMCERFNIRAERFCPKYTPIIAICLN